MILPMTVDDTGLSCLHGKEIQLVLVPLTRLSMHEAIVVYVERTFLHRVSVTASLHCSDSFLCGRAFYTFTRSPLGVNRPTVFLLASVTRRLAAFLVSAWT